MTQAEFNLCVRMALAVLGPGPVTVARAGPAARPLRLAARSQPASVRGQCLRGSEDLSHDDSELLVAVSEPGSPVCPGPGGARRQPRAGPRPGSAESEQWKLGKSI